MKNKKIAGKTVNIIFIFLIMLTASSCIKADPKALAKQSYDLNVQALDVALDAKKSAAIGKKKEVLEAKVAKLPDADRAIYTQELIRLAGKGIGSLFK